MDKQANQGLTNSIKNRMDMMSIIKGLVIAYAFTLPTFFLFSLILSYTDFPDKYITTVVIIITVMSILIAGMVSSRNVGSKGWLNGAIVGFIYVLVLYFLSSIILRDISINRSVISMTAIGILAGSIGGIVGINIKANSRVRSRGGRR
ncbi:MAG: TIGR04086 family membrane protein [Clostridia bacterium]|nr:TIGR04086 family membrane protein [Clostridia bacterium]